MTGLGQGDFDVLEDGKPQKVATFSPVNIPVARQPRPLFAKAPIEPDVEDNLTGYDGRVYVLMLDDVHTNALRTQRTKATARQFIERYIGANDSAAVVFTSGRSDAAQEFTNSQRRLLAAVDKFMGRKIRSATMERLDEEARTRDIRQQGDRVNDMLDPERSMNARTTLDSIRSLATYLGGISGRRKAIVYFSEGIDYDINDVFNNQGASTIITATQDAIAAATRANVTIYGVDARGLGAGMRRPDRGPGLSRRPVAEPGHQRLQQRDAARPGQPARAVERDRRLRAGQLERLRRRLRAARRRQQLLLPARLLLDQRAARRPGTGRSRSRCASRG